VSIRGSGKVVRKLCAPCASSTPQPPTITNVKVAGCSSRCDAEMVQGIGCAVRAIAEGDTQALGCACAAELSASKVGPCVQHQHKNVLQHLNRSININNTCECAACPYDSPHLPPLQFSPPLLAPAGGVVCAQVRGLCASTNKLTGRDACICSMKIVFHLLRPAPVQDADLQID
jgi:hypothetical protein